MNRCGTIRADNIHEFTTLLTFDAHRRILFRIQVCHGDGFDLAKLAGSVFFSRSPQKIDIFKPFGIAKAFPVIKTAGRSAFQYGRIDFIETLVRTFPFSVQLFNRSVFFLHCGKKPFTHFRMHITAESVGKRPFIHEIQRNEIRFVSNDRQQYSPHFLDHLSGGRNIERTADPAAGSISLHFRECLFPCFRNRMRRDEKVVCEISPVHIFDVAQDGVSEIGTLFTRCRSCILYDQRSADEIESCIGDEVNIRIDLPPAMRPDEDDRVVTGVECAVSYTKIIHGYLRHRTVPVSDLSREL